MDLDRALKDSAEQNAEIFKTMEAIYSANYVAVVRAATLLCQAGSIAQSADNVTVSLTVKLANSFAVATMLNLASRLDGKKYSLEQVGTDCNTVLNKTREAAKAFIRGRRA